MSRPFLSGFAFLRDSYSFAAMAGKNQIQSSQEQRNKHPGIRKPEPQKILVAFVPTEMPGKEFSSLVRAAGDRPEKFGDRYDDNTGGEQGPRDPPLRLQYKKKNSDNE